MAARLTQAQTDAILLELRAFGLAYPGTHTKSPWPGHLDLAVKDKTFAYLSLEGEPLGVSCKLPQSCQVALMLPFCKPAGYGLGKSGWVDARFALGDDPPVEMLKQWLDESYRAQAPAKLVKQLGVAPGAPAPTTAAAKAKKPAKQAKAKKPAKKPRARRATRGPSAAARPARRARRTRRS